MKPRRQPNATKICVAFGRSLSRTAQAQSGDTKPLCLTIASVGARGLVHRPQFNGKQEERPTRAALTCAAPATVSG